MAARIGNKAMHRNKRLRATRRAQSPAGDDQCVALALD
jgi:hypothetical protein